MKKLQIILILSCFAAMLFVGCMEDGADDKNVLTVWLQPYNGFPESQLLKLQSDMQNCLDSLVPERTFKVEVLEDRKIPASCYYKPKNRYRADSIIHYQQTFEEPGYILGITNKDISSTVHGKADWGILGLSFCPGHSAVVSTYRVGNKVLFYKVAVHELLHCFGLPHCSQKDRSCYICDADKHPQLEKQTRLCDACRKKLQGKKSFK